VAEHPPGTRTIAELDPRHGDLRRARAVVAGLRPADPTQAAVRDQLLRFVDAHPDALERTCAPGHLTGSAVVLDSRGERCLVLLHTKLRKWLQPGGHADGEGELAAVALREATEETGIADLRVLPEPIDVDVHEVRPPGEAPHLHHDVRFLVLAPPGAIERGNHESQALRWVTRGELDELGADESLRRLVDAGVRAFRALSRG
jgi:8-oxo-dGTP pyrophosphatase MutT (NUDIX family)